MSSHYFPSGTSTVCWARSKFSPGLEHAHFAVALPTRGIVEEIKLRCMWHRWGSGPRNPPCIHTCLKGLHHCAFPRYWIKKSTEIAILWLHSLSAFPVISPSYVVASGSQTTVGISVHFSTTSLFAASLCPSVTRCPSAADPTSPISQGYNPLFSSATPFLFSVVFTLFCHLAF